MVRNVVVLVHGYGEHVFRPQYDLLAQVIEECGWEVERHVIREHWDGDPSSASHSYYYDSFHTILSELSSHIEAVKEQDDNTRIVVVGKSLGGLLAIRSLEEEISDIISGAIALSPCLAIGEKYDTPLKRALAYLVTDWFGWKGFYSPWDQLDPSDVTAKPEEYVSDPHILSCGIYAAIAVSTRNETFIAHEKKDLITAPLLILHGSEDLICNPDTSEEFTRDLAEHCTTRLYQNTVHDLLDEDKTIVDQIHEEIRQFLNNIVK